MSQTLMQTSVSLYKDVVFFFFSFISKTSAREASVRERAVNKSPAVHILPRALDGLRRENGGSVNRLDIDSGEIFGA